MAQDWQSYDTAAGVHDRVATPAIFEPPARDLVAALGPSIAGAILDVGAGTGVAARMAIESSPGAVVVALDPSFEMLRAARSRKNIEVGQYLRARSGGHRSGMPAGQYVCRALHQYQ